MKFRACCFQIAMSGLFVGVFALAAMIAVPRGGARPIAGAAQQNPSQQSRPQNRPRPQPNRPGGGPTIQPVPGPRPNPGRPTSGRPGVRPPRPGPGRPPSNRPLPPYQWRPGDRDRVRRYYRRNFGYINRGRRPSFIVGGFIPFGDRGYFRPLPPPLLGYLPPPPPGYVIGYFDGYAIVYDPISFTILSVVDLLD